MFFSPKSFCLLKFVTLYNEELAVLSELFWGVFVYHLQKLCDCNQF